jgi:hypothetical protein
MEKVTEVKALNDYFIQIKFKDGLVGKLNIQPFIKGEMAQPLLDKDYFKKVKVDEMGGICWENGFDFCPNYLKELITK